MREIAAWLVRARRELPLRQAMTAARLTQQLARFHRRRISYLTFNSPILGGAGRSVTSWLPCPP